MLGKSCVILYWHSLSLPYDYLINKNMMMQLVIILLFGSIFLVSGIVESPMILAMCEQNYMMCIQYLRTL